MRSLRSRTSSGPLFSSHRNGGKPAASKESRLPGNHTTSRANNRDLVSLPASHSEDQQDQAFSVVLYLYAGFALFLALGIFHLGEADYGGSRRGHLGGETRQPHLHLHSPGAPGGSDCTRRLLRSSPVQNDTPPTHPRVHAS